jgi:hypothetical protein
LSQDFDEITLGIDFALFLYRTDKKTMLEDIVIEEDALKVLKKRDSVDIWKEFERTKVDSVQLARQLNERIIKF